MARGSGPRRRGSRRSPPGPGRARAPTPSTPPPRPASSPRGTGGTSPRPRAAPPAGRRPRAAPPPSRALPSPLHLLRFLAQAFPPLAIGAPFDEALVPQRPEHPERLARPGASGGARARPVAADAVEHEELAAVEHREPPPIRRPDADRVPGAGHELAQRRARGRGEPAAQEQDVPPRAPARVPAANRPGGRLDATAVEVEHAQGAVGGGEGEPPAL